MTIRSDNQSAEVGIYDDDRQIVYEVWHAHRELAESIHIKLASILETSQMQWTDIQGIIAYEGPGSFTGIRIGLSVANALSYSLDIPIVGSNGKEWIPNGKETLSQTDEKVPLKPKYGAEPNVTKPVK